MKIFLFIIILVIFLFLLDIVGANAQTTRTYDNRGRLIEKTITDSNGIRRNYDDKGRFTGREVPRNNGYSVYDNKGKLIRKIEVK